MKVLFVCTGNSCRSQMAEGFARAAGVEAYSSGTEPAGYLHPLAVKAMAEKGVDISGHTSKGLDLELARNVDVVITVCGEAEEACPVIPVAHRAHWPVRDPAKAAGAPEEVLPVFRAVRDDIARRVSELLNEQKTDGALLSKGD